MIRTSVFQYTVPALFLLILFGGFISKTEGETEAPYEKEIAKHRKKIHRDFLNPRKSPLPEEDRSEFKGLAYYPADPKFKVMATLKFTPESPEIGFATSSGKIKQFKQYAEVHFSINRKDYVLGIFQNLHLLEKKKYRDYLFLPFKDLTTGDETYGGGRYLELTKPKNRSDQLEIDFNKCFNPYCAYKTVGYSCPIPPDENFLDLKITAGVKKWH